MIKTGANRYRAELTFWSKREQKKLTRDGPYRYVKEDARRDLRFLPPLPPQPVPRRIQSSILEEEFRFPFRKNSRFPNLKESNFKLVEGIFFFYLPTTTSRVDVNE